MIWCLCLLNVIWVPKNMRLYKDLFDRDVEKFQAKASILHDKHVFDLVALTCCNFQCPHPFLAGWNLCRRFSLQSILKVASPIGLAGGWGGTPVLWRGGQHPCGATTCPLLAFGFFHHCFSQWTSLQSTCFLIHWDRCVGERLGD